MEQQSVQEKKNQYPQLDDDDEQKVENIIKVDICEDLKTQKEYMGAIETHYYQLKVAEGKKIITIYRSSNFIIKQLFPNLHNYIFQGYSDFLWLFNQLNYTRKGYLIPPIPEKDVKVKVANLWNSISIFQMQNKINSQENSAESELETLKIRKVVFQQFLNILLNHKDLKNDKDLKKFLTEENNAAFQEYQKNSEYEDYFQHQGYPIVEFTKNSFSKVLNYFSGSQQQSMQYNNQKDEQLETEKEDEKKLFKEFMDKYTKKLNNLKTIQEVFQGVFSYKLKNAENMKEAEEIFQNIDQLILEGNQDEELEGQEEQKQNYNNELSKYGNLINQCEKAQQEQYANYQTVIKEMQWPLMDDTLRAKIKSDKILLSRLCDNFKKDQEGFNNMINKNLEELVANVFFLFSTFVGISKCAFHSADNLYTISKDSKNDNNIPGDQDRLVGMAANPSATAGNKNVFVVAYVSDDYQNIQLECYKARGLTPDKKNFIVATGGKVVDISIALQDPAGDGKYIVAASISDGSCIAQTYDPTANNFASITTLTNVAAGSNCKYIKVKYYPLSAKVGVVYSRTDGGNLDVFYRTISTAGQASTEIKVNTEVQGDTTYSDSSELDTGKAVVVIQGVGKTFPLALNEIPLHIQEFDISGVNPAKTGDNIEVSGTVGNALEHKKPIIQQYQGSKKYSIAWTVNDQIWFASYTYDNTGAPTHKQDCITVLGEGILSDFTIIGEDAYIVGRNKAGIGADEEKPFGLQVKISCTIEREKYFLGTGKQFKQSAIAFTHINNQITTLPTVYLEYTTVAAAKTVKANEFFLSQYAQKDPLLVPPSYNCADPRCFGCVGDLTCNICSGTTPELREVRKRSSGDCSCQDGYFNTDGNRDCTRCLHQCKTCKNNTACDICVDTKMFKPDCTTPEEGHYTYEKAGKTEYAECAPKCKNCKTTAEQCTECRGQNRMQGGDCSCLKNFYDYDGQLQDCVECPKLCDGCVNGYTCIDCKDKETLNRELNPFTGECECAKGYIPDPDPSIMACVQGYQISDGFIDKCPQNTYQNESTKVCEYIEYSLVSNMVLIIIMGILIAIVQVSLCCTVHMLVQKRYQAFAEKFHEEQMKLKQQRAYIYKGLDYDAGNPLKAHTNELTSVNNGGNNETPSKGDDSSNTGGAGQRRRRRNLNTSQHQSSNSLMESQHDLQQSNIHLIKNDNTQSQIFTNTEQPKNKDIDDLIDEIEA